MHRIEKLSVRSSWPAVARVRSTRNESNKSTVASRTRRLGRALMEMVLIAGVPCFCLLCLMLLDSEMQKSLLATPGSDPGLGFNTVFALIPADRGTVVSLHAQGQVRFWDTASSKVLGEVQCEVSDVRCGAYCAQKRLLALGTALGKLEVRDLDHPENSVTSQVCELPDFAACQFTPDGSLLIGAGDQHAISFWDPRTLRRLHVAEFDPRDEVVRSLAISDDGQYLLAGTHGGVVQVWDVGERKLVRRISVTKTRFRPAATIDAVGVLPGNREFVALSHHDGASVWSLATGELVRKLEGPLPGVRCGALSTDGNYLTAGSGTGELRVWDVRTGACVKSMSPRAAIIRAIACDERSQKLLTGDWSGEIHSHGL